MSEDRESLSDDGSADGGQAFEEQLDVAGMSVGEYRRLRDRVAAEGRESLSDAERERYDAADAEMTAAMRKVQDVVARSWKPPPMVEDLRQQIAAASTTDFTAMYESIARVGLSPAERLGKEVVEALDLRSADEVAKLMKDSPLRTEWGRSGVSGALPPSVPPVDDAVFEGIAEAREAAQAEEAAHRVAELEALAQIAAVVESNVESVELLRRDSAEAAESSFRVAWWGVGLMGLTLIVSTAALIVAW